MYVHIHIYMYIGPLLWGKEYWATSKQRRPAKWPSAISRFGVKV